MTLPIEVRTALGIEEGTYLEVSEEDDEIRLRKVVPIRPLSEEGPIWGLVGASKSGYSDVAADHDRHVADAQVERLRDLS